MNNWGAFAFGVFIGAQIGVIVAGLLAAANDDR